MPLLLMKVPEAKAMMGGSFLDRNKGRFTNGTSVPSKNPKKRKRHGFSVPALVWAVFMDGNRPGRCFELGLVDGLLAILLLHQGVHIEPSIAFS